jgi:predicted ester cyclase
MGAEENKRLVRRYLEEVVATGDVSGIAEFIAPDYVEVYEGKRFLLGLEGAREHVLGVRRTYPDLSIEVGLQVAEGDWVATSIVARGTHRGEWLGIAPTGKVLAFTGVNLDRVAGGRIVEHGGAANLLGPLLEAGAVRPVRPGDGG